MANAAQNAQKGGTRCPLRRPIYLLEAAYATGFGLGGDRGQGQAELEAGAVAAEGGSQTTSSPSWAMASWRAM